MNRQYFTNSTRLAVIHIKELNYKLCRKGLLERCSKMKIYAGEFKVSENVFLVDSLNSNDNALTKMIETKMKLMENEISKIENSLKALERTISSIKNDVQSRVSSETYQVWLKHIDKISIKFKTHFSNINNDEYNNIYKMHKNSKIWENVSLDLKWIKKNVCDTYVDVDINKSVIGFEENDLAELFDENSKTKAISKNEVSESTLTLKNATQPIPSSLKRNADNKVPVHHTLKKSKLQDIKTSIQSTIEDCGLEEISDEESSNVEISSSSGFSLVDETGTVEMEEFEKMLGKAFKCNKS